MGVSQPKTDSININLIINGQLCNSIPNVEPGAPAPISGLNVICKGKDSKGRDIPVNVNLKNNSINCSDNLTLENTKNEEDSTCGKNKDNNIGQNRSYSKELNNSSFTLFNSNNLQNIDLNNIINTNDEKNKNENNNNEINNYEKPNNNNKENNNNDNNLLKEGIKQVTKFGDEEEDSKENKSGTDRGDKIDINMGKKENILNNQGNTDKGQQDINFGSKFNKNEVKDKYEGYNYSESDLVISQNINLSEEKTLEESQVLLDKGLFPLFLKLNDCKPLFFYAERKTKLIFLLKIYFDKNPEFDKSILNDIQLYSGKRLLDINEEIQYLKIPQLSLISNKAGEELEKTKE